MLVEGVAKAALRGVTAHGEGDALSRQSPSSSRASPLRQRFALPPPRCFATGRIEGKSLKLAAHQRGEEAFMGLAQFVQPDLAIGRLVAVAEVEGFAARPADEATADPLVA